MNHYALFKCYMFLKNCGSGDILLKIVKVEHEEMPEAKNVVAVLEEFMKETLAQSFWSHVLRGFYCDVVYSNLGVWNCSYYCHRIAL